MPENNPPAEEFDWNVTTFDGSRREQLRRWSKSSLEDILSAQEEMADLSRRFSDMRAQRKAQNTESIPTKDASQATSLREPKGSYNSRPSTNEITLHGCMPEPLMSYLKALGVLRLVSEQADPFARGFWRDDKFVLQSKLNLPDLQEFFTSPWNKDLSQYRPSPIIVPWSGNDFFQVKSNRKIQNVKKTPTGSDIIEAFLSCQSDRFKEYRHAIVSALETLQELGITKKAQIEKPQVKSQYIAELRGRTELTLSEWIDAATVLSTDKANFSALLGSGGGSDGNTHFSDNFMQNLWDVLPDFDGQRSSGKKLSGNQTDTCLLSRYWLNGALLGEPINNMIDKRTSSIFDAGAVGGPNATQGMERKAALNPWNFILALEGTICFAGALAKRASLANQGLSTFPFQVRLSSSNNNRTTNKETAGREIWFPLWNNPTTFAEIRQLLSQGRIEVSGKTATRGVDAARAVASLGVDQGITAFQRYAVIKGRVGGDNYNTAASMGKFEVKAQQHVNLLCEVDDWLYRFRRACSIGSKEEAPMRLTSALRNIDTAVFDYCRYGGRTYFQAILVALGRAERELMRDGRWAQKNNVPPLYGLTPDWIEASWDGSPEFELALSLAGMRGAGKVGPLRGNLEPIYIGRRNNGAEFINWAEKDRTVVWNQANLSNNLTAILARRMQDAAKHGNEYLPLWSGYSASLETVAAFLSGQTDDNRLEELLWGLMLVNHSRPNDSRLTADLPDSPPLPRIYALLKLLFLPTSIVYQAGNWRYTRREENGIAIKPEPRILPLLRAGRIDDAVDIAVQRLRSSGLQPMITRGEQGPFPDGGQRLAAALLFPVHSYSLDRLLKLVVRGNSTAMKQEGEAA